MKIDRRSFLALSVGGAVGTALTPLPWKIQDDLAIWTQMWPWTPFPPDGENTYVNTVSTLCQGGCGVTVRKVGVRVRSPSFAMVYASERPSSRTGRAKKVRAPE